MKSMTEQTYRGLFRTLALLGATLDQASKYSVFQALRNEGRGDEYALIPGAFELVAHYGPRDSASLDWHADDSVPQVNHGALFGIFGQYHMLANAVFAAVSVGAAAFIVYWSFRQSTARDKWLSTALGLILAGTLGNLYDRLVFNGVRDFLHWFKWFEYPVFNVADCCLVVGAFLLLTQAFWGHAEAPTSVVEEPCFRQEVAEV